MTDSTLQHSEAKAWLVDLDGTLYRPGAVKLAMAVELLLCGWSAVKVLKPFRHAHEELREELRTDPLAEFLPHPFAEQARRAAAKTGRSAEEVERIARSWMVERPAKWLSSVRRTSLLKEIADFRGRGGKTAVVSDYPATTKLTALGAVHLFDVVVSSGETAGLTRLKPCPDAFLLAATKLGVAPEHCLVIGDRDDADGAAARAGGMSFRLVG
jgi:HAD superfamily hydrolase (TIGR01549 family)